MRVTYFANGKRHEADIHWFTDRGASNQPQDIWTLATDCAKDYYERDDGWDDPKCKFPCEIALCIGNREIGRELVNLEFEPVFEVEH